MTRLAILILPCLFGATSLAAQTVDSSAGATDDSRAGVVEMTIQRPLTADTNGVPDTLDAVVTDRLVLNYELQNVGETDMRLEYVEVADAVNCKVLVTTMPERVVAAGRSTLMVLEATPEAEGPLSFTVNMYVDGAPYSIPVQTTVTALLDHEHHCHWWGCHEHDDHHHHCSTGDGSSWALLGAAAVALAAVMVRRRV